MKQVFRLMFDDDAIAEFGTARSANAAYRLVLASLKTAGVDFTKHRLLLLSALESSNG